MNKISFITLITTFFLILLPYFVYNIIADISGKRQKAFVYLKKYISTGLFFSMFFLLFFSFYKKQGIIDAVKSLAETVNTGFVAMSYLTSFVILLVHTISKKNGGMFDIDFSRIPGYINASLLVFFFMINISFTMTRMYGIIPLEQIIFHLSLAGTGANFSIVEKAIVIILFQTFVFQVISLYVLSAKINFEMRVWRGAVYVPFGKFRNFFVFFAAILPAAGFVYLVNTIGLPQYIETSIGNPSVFYEENYIFPARVKIDFPERKRNLIVIFVEGLETGYLTTENGGAFTEDLMPEVASLAKNNINFSGNGGIGGPVQLYGTEWTIAGIAAYYSGLPLAVRFLNLTGWNNYSTMGDEFMPGAYSMGDILYDSGYRSFYFLGSEIEFGGRDKYFKTHKNTVIYDYSYFKNNRYIPDGYGVWWGIEDRKLYELAKIKIAEISREEPFFITLLTADTHPADGYLDNEAERIFDSQFKNVIRDMSRQLSAFVEWLTEQDFYENTTIVILGDHLYQELSFFPDDFRIQKVSSKYENRYFTEDSTKSYNRYPINIFINSLFDSRNAKNRTFSHFDMLPVMIESIGGIFDSEGLALGRSLFKGSTLAEKYGEAEMNRQLRLKSELYDLFWRK